MNKSFRPLFVVSLIFSIFWLITCLLSMIETFFVGLGIWYSPTVGLSLYIAIDSFFAEDGGNLAMSIAVFFEGLVAVPLVLGYISIIFLPTILIVFIFYGSSLLVSVIYGAISIAFLLFEMIIAIGLLITSAISLKKSEIKGGALKAARVFAILGLVSLLVAWAPTAFSLITVCRYIDIFVACILALVGASKGLKAKKEEQKLAIVK